MAWPGQPDWTYGAVAAGVDDALRVLRTEYLDIVHLHSCGLEILRQGEVITRAGGRAPGGQDPPGRLFGRK